MMNRLIITHSLMKQIDHSEYKDREQVKLQQAFVQGYNQGLANAVSSLFQQTNTCQPVNIFVGNSSKNIIDIACLQK